MMSSAPTMTTRLQRPWEIQSHAVERARVVDAHAALTWTLGPLAPMNSAICECPMPKTRNRKSRGKR